MKKMLQIGLLAMFSLIATIGFSQNRTVTGVVTSSDDNQPLVGVSIVVKGTSNGTVTDIDGNYSLSVPEKSTLVYSFVGYTSVETPLGDGSVMNLSMNGTADVLNELVVTGYGSQIKRELTGNIARLKGKDVENLPFVSVDQAIQGKAAGVFVNGGSERASKRRGRYCDWFKTTRVEGRRDQQPFEIVRRGEAHRRFHLPAKTRRPYRHHRCKRLG